MSYMLSNFLKIKPEAPAARLGQCGGCLTSSGGKKAVSGKVSGRVPCSMCPGGLGHADKVDPSPSAHPSVRDNAAILNLLPIQSFPSVQRMGEPGKT